MSIVKIKIKEEEKSLIYSFRLKLALFLKSSLLMKKVDIVVNKRNILDEIIFTVEISIPKNLKNEENLQKLIFYALETLEEEKVKFILFPKDISIRTDYKDLKRTISFERFFVREIIKKAFLAINKKEEKANIGIIMDTNKEEMFFILEQIFPFVGNITLIKEEKEETYEIEENIFNLSGLIVGKADIQKKKTLKYDVVVNCREDSKKFIGKNYSKNQIFLDLSYNKEWGKEVLKRYRLCITSINCICKNKFIENDLLSGVMYLKYPKEFRYLSKLYCTNVDYKNIRNTLQKEKINVYQFMSLSFPTVIDKEI